MGMKGIIPIVVALGLALAVAFGIAVGNCGFNEHGNLQCVGLGNK